MLNKTIKYALTSLLIIFFLLKISSFASANPIPVFPDPQPTFQSQQIGNIADSGFQIWIIFIFLLDYACNILILYSGLYILSKIGLLKETDLTDFSRLLFIASVFIISIFGILVEWLLGFWIIGLILVLFFVFLSYILVSIYLLKINFKNSTFLGFYAIVINLIIWLVIFSF
jgi:hypothetical protein